MEAVYSTVKQQEVCILSHAFLTSPAAAIGPTLAPTCQPASLASTPPSLHQGYSQLLWQGLKCDWVMWLCQMQVMPLEQLQRERYKLQTQEYKYFKGEPLTTA